jgi:hypothetical protein
VILQHTHAQRDEEQWVHRLGDTVKSFDVIIEMQRARIVPLLVLMQVPAPTPLYVPQNSFYDCAAIRTCLPHSKYIRIHNPIRMWVHTHLVHIHAEDQR